MSQYPSQTVLRRCIEKLHAAIQGCFRRFLFCLFLFLPTFEHFFYPIALNNSHFLSTIWFRIDQLSTFVFTSKIKYNISSLIFYPSFPNELLIDWIQPYSSVFSIKYICTYMLYYIEQCSKFHAQSFHLAFTYYCRHTPGLKEIVNFRERIVSIRKSYLLTFSWIFALSARDANFYFPFSMLLLRKFIIEFKISTLFF